MRATRGIQVSFLSQCLVLSQYLFAPVMDELMRPIQGKVSWCMLFANNIVLVDE